MAGTGLLALLDDIASILDDVAALTQVAAKKTAGVLGDDLALNAEQVTGVATARELPVVWAVAKGSAFNKVVLVPAALGISALAPWAITPLLMFGGAFLCYEGVEKLAHRFLTSKDEDAQRKAHTREALADPSRDMVAFERDKIRGAVRTDLILSAEIVVISLGTVATAPLATRIGVLCGISVLMTVGVYGLVAGIVKLDDAGMLLQRSPNRAARALGSVILRGAPYLMKALSIAGTAAMFLVGGGIVLHGVHVAQAGVERAAAELGTVPGVGVILPSLVSALASLITGLVTGAIALAGASGVRSLIKAVRRPKPR